jgi:hypothetical protein
MKRLSKFLACGVAALAMTAVSARAATPCTATVHARPAQDQVTSDSLIKVWAVDVDTQVDCAKVYVDGTVTERLFDGEEITVTRRGWRKVSTLTETYKVNYTIAKDSTLTDWNFKVAKCVVCGTE